MVVGNDTLALLRAGTERGWGVAVVCGAGINCVGVGPDGSHVRFPALGAITGDWGGGYDVGSEALFAAARSEDGRGARTSLQHAVPGHFGLDSPRRLAEEMHVGRISHRRLIELAPVVFAEAAHDPAAAAIVERLADEVVALARVALTKLDLDKVPVEVVLGGGLLRAGDERLQAAIAAGLPRGRACDRGAHDRCAAGRRSGPPRARLARCGRRRQGACATRAHRRRGRGRRPGPGASGRSGGTAWLTSGSSVRRASIQVPKRPPSTPSISISQTPS